MATEPRALTAALSQPAFVTNGLGLASRVADRHVERWAPEAGASRVRSLRNLAFVDRLVSPWIESAQRSSSLRLFSQYISSGVAERPAPASGASWVFPRPWYQDELDWMAAARHVQTQVAVDPNAAPTMLTTRGTYVAPTYSAIPSRLALPTQLHEYVAPSLSIARQETGSPMNAYSPLVSAQTASTAQMMTSAVAPLLASRAFTQATPARALSPGLRAVLATMLERSAQTSVEPIATRSSAYAPEMVTPPAPREDVAAPARSAPALEVADRTAEQRARIVELQRVAEREYQARAVAAATHTSVNVPTAARVAEIQQRATEQATRREEARQGDLRREMAASNERTASLQAERARIEERIAQRVAERTRQVESQRLHETAREAAARDARIAAAQIEAPTEPAVGATEPPRVAAALAAAVAALPPELASMVAGTISQHPERAAQAIAELNEALRVVELMARNTAAGGSIAPSAGPRVVMPAGLGGLVATVERTSSPAGEQRAPRMFAQPMSVPIAQTSAPVVRETRTPTLAWLTPAAQPTTSALGAAMQSTPVALQHVAWSDRWLARFAGAQPQSLDVFTAAAAASPELRASLIANAAPAFAFVAPVAETPVSATPAAAPEPARADQVVRYADDAETPDDVFLAIASATSTARKSNSRQVATDTAAVAAARSMASLVAASQSYDPLAAPTRETVADFVAHAAPIAPGAGLAAGLASSPFAAALRHVLPMGVAPTFDVRALFGSSLSATYLSGLIAASVDEISISRALPTWATIGDASLTASADMPLTRDVEVAGWQPTYVSPEASAHDAAAGETHDAGTELVATSLASLTTLRSALLSFDIERSSTSSTSTIAATSQAFAPSIAQSFVAPLSMPLLADTAVARGLSTESAMAAAASYGAPGQVAGRAEAWSVAQERSTADLAFDFIAPELLLAARVYGLGPAEAAQAVRLAVAGPGQLAAMAGVVDRTFVQAMAIEADRRTTSSARGQTISTAYPVTMPDGTIAMMPSSTTPTQSGDVTTSTQATFAPGTSAFGVERRMPRGAFLWPAASTAALGLSALQPDSEQSMSVVALELLAAQAVAELGTYAALGHGSESERTALASVASHATEGATTPTNGAEPSDADVLASAAAFVPASRRDKFQALYVALSHSPSGRIASPAARAARALALAGRGEDTITARERASVAWDVLPVVFGEADREREDGAPMSTGDAAARLVRQREALRAMDMLQVDSRPGLSGLASRAGEALSAYATPVVASQPTAADGSSRRADGAVMRVPTAAPELVQTGRPTGQFGGGELEIPTWFEQAARKMLAERSGGTSGGISGDISLAELTLVTAAPAQQIAASSKSHASSSAAAAHASHADAGGGGKEVDVDKLAEDIYREVLAMMDVARARNGEPYL